MPDPSGSADKPGRGVDGGEAVLGDGRTVELADFPQRVAARFLDPVVVSLFVLGTFIIVGFDGVMSTPMVPNAEAGLNDLDRDIVQRANLIVSLVVFGVLVLYEMARIGSSGQTWGKRRRRVRVVTRRDGATPSPERALVRGLVPAAAGAGGSVAALLADLRVPCAWRPGAVDRGVCVGDVGHQRPRLARPGCGHRRHRRPRTPGPAEAGSTRARLGSCRCRRSIGLTPRATGSGVLKSTVSGSRERMTMSGDTGETPRRSSC